MENLKLSVFNKENPAPTPITVGGLTFGTDFILIAGPCSVENEKQTILTAHRVKSAGANMLRGGAFKPRKSPYSFQGLGKKGLEILKKAKEETGLPIVTEVLDTRDVEMVCKYADIVQIGARSMQNTALLKEVGKCNTPVLLKKGMSSPLEEWLFSAEYIMNEGNKNVILCERGIRTFETHTRFTQDLSMVPAVKNISPLPVVVDPSHGTGIAGLVPAMAMAALTAGADGLLIEVHYDPHSALSDKDQTMKPDDFVKLVKKLKRIHTLMKEFRAEED